MRHVIIGNSAAGIFAAEAIRSIDRTGNITMVSQEAEGPYSRCLTSYLISGNIKEEQVFIRSKGFYQELGILPLLGRSVTGIDSAMQNLYLSDGTTVPYDRLLIATGSSPFKPPIAGIDAEGVFVLRTLADARKIVQALIPAGETVVIGGGLVGLKAAKALRARGQKVTIVEFFSHLMPQSLDLEGAAFLQEVLEQEGFKILLNARVEKISYEENGSESKPWVTGVVLASGQTVPCQMVILAAGVIPNTGFLKDSRISVNRGIPVDERMQTNVPNIYAAGDVAETFDPLWEQYRMNALWPCATLQGQVAGCNMAGLAKKYPGSIGMNSAEFYGLPIISAGITHSLPQCREYRQKDYKTYRKLVIRDNRLVGFIAMGDIHGAGVLTGLIQKRIDISGVIDQLLNGPLDYALTYRGHTGFTGKEAACESFN